MRLRVSEHAPDQLHLERTEVQLIQVFLPHLCQGSFHEVANCNSAVRRYGPSARTSSSCVPTCTIRPSSNTMMRSARRNELIRLATMNVVRPRMAFSIA